MRERKQNTVSKTYNNCCNNCFVWEKKRTVNFRPVARKTYIGSY